MKERTYLAIDLKSFYASVECMERGLDPMTTNLVVADLSRTEKTILPCRLPIPQAARHSRTGTAVRSDSEGEGRQPAAGETGARQEIHRRFVGRYAAAAASRACH